MRFHPARIFAFITTAIIAFTGLQLIAIGQVDNSQVRPPATAPATVPAAPRAGRGGRGRFVNPQPDVAYLPKPATHPADWLVEHDPVTPNASPEARALLHYLYTISNKHTLTGQHNYTESQGKYTAIARDVTGRTPPIYGTDWGFMANQISMREEVTQAIIKEYREHGSIIALVWHELRPIDDEPADIDLSVRAKLTDAQFNDVITPGTALYNRWCAQVDVIAKYMKELQDAHVPILFRPYHEMNGDWFWWGGRRGQRGTMQMYRQIWDRFVNYYHFNNLIWVWNVDQPAREDRQFVDYFPGQQYVDVLGLDDYGRWNQSFYDDLNALSDGKPLAIAECGANVPDISVFDTQPKWSYFMIWSGYLPEQPARGGRRGNPAAARTPAPSRLIDIFGNPRMFNLEDQAYTDSIADLRKVSGLPPLMPLPKLPPATRPGN